MKWLERDEVWWWGGIHTLVTRWDYYYRYYQYDERLTVRSRARR